MKKEKIRIELPTEIWEDMSITHWARRLYCTIKNISLVTGSNFDWPNSMIAHYFKVSKQCASNYVNELIRAGYIELVSFDGRKRVLKIKEE